MDVQYYAACSFLYLVYSFKFIFRACAINSKAIIQDRLYHAIIEQYPCEVRWKALRIVIGNLLKSLACKGISKEIEFD